MIKNISILLVLLLTFTCYGQNITLLQNTNPKAKELKHNLNSANDSLILESKTKIIHVEIFNEDYEKLILVDGFNMQLSLDDIPEGKFVIETKLADKIIIMGLMRHHYSGKSTSSMLSKNNEVAEGKGMMLDEELNVIKSSPNKSIAFLLTHTGTEKRSTKSTKYFWTETQINNESGSSKTMRLVDQKSVDNMINRHKLEINSDTGKLNKLTVWEVYKKGEFMENQVSNPEFVYSLATELFNPNPYYSTTSNLQNL